MSAHMIAGALTKTTTERTKINKEKTKRERGPEGSNSDREPGRAMKL